MTRQSQFRLVLLGTACLAGTAQAESFNVPEGDLRAALSAYSSQAHVQLMVSDEAVKGARTDGVQGDLSADTALSHILKGTGFTAHRISSGAIGIIPTDVRGSLEPESIPAIQLAQSSTIGRGQVETVTVTSSKLGGVDVQNVPIAITALSQEQLTATQTSGGPDLVRQIPNFNFSKTNFSGYNIEIRGIGTQAVSVATDPAVAVSFNDTPFIRNHFFEQEFFDVAQVEVLRGPQGTLYGRNATAGVVNVISAKPSNQYEAQASVDVGNYNNRRLEGMLNIPLVDDKLGVRLAGEWTKRDGYDYNLTTQHPVNGRDLWSGRVTVGLNPISSIKSNLIWEHFSEDDDRSRTGKQLCHHDSGPESVGDIATLTVLERATMSQGCLPGSLYDAGAFGTPNGLAIPFVLAASEGNQALNFGTGFIGYNADGQPIALINGTDPYGGMMQSRNLREISSIKDPKFRARNDVVEYNVDIAVTPALTLTSQTGYNKDSYYSTQDYNRFNTVPVFNSTDGLTRGGFFDTTPAPPVTPGGVFCDPQIGCSSSIAGFDISQAKSEQFSQELRLASNYDGPLNFSLGANYLRYRTLEDYYVLFNVVTAVAEGPGLVGNASADPNLCTRGGISPTPIGDPGTEGCIYIDPNTLENINGEGHNYFRSENPYRLHSYSGFGEIYWQAMPDLKVTAGIRYTDDNKRFTPVPSQTLLSSFILTGGDVDRGYPAQPDIDQHWGEVTGRLNVQWSPKLAFTDQSTIYASYSRGYKGGGANPPGIGYNPTPICDDPTNPVCKPFVQSLGYPKTFDPEFINAFEIGSKNSLLDGGLVFNGTVFFYDYKNYQISQIVDRTAVNQNFDAKVWGTEIEGSWEPLPGLRFNFAGGYEGSRADDNQFSIDLMDRLQGHGDEYTIMKPFLVLPSNCVVSKEIVAKTIAYAETVGGTTTQYLTALCPGSFLHNALPFLVDFPVPDSALPNNGQGFFANVGGNELPNTPNFTLSLGAQYTMPVSSDWAGTLRTDFYWQSSSFARIYNDKPYDQLHAYTNLNLALIFTNQDGWQAMAYLKNVFDTTAITGTFLNSDDTALTTNIFTTDPRLFGIRITKNW